MPQTNTPSRDLAYELLRERGAPITTHNLNSAMHIVATNPEIYQRLMGQPQAPEDTPSMESQSRLGPSKIQLPTAEDEAAVSARMNPNEPVPLDPSGAPANIAGGRRRNVDTSMVPVPQRKPEIPVAQQGPAAEPWTGTESVTAAPDKGSGAGIAAVLSAPIIGKLLQGLLARRGIKGGGAIPMPEPGAGVPRLPPPTPALPPPGGAAVEVPPAAPPPRGVIDAEFTPVPPPGAVVPPGSIPTGPPTGAPPINMPGPPIPTLPGPSPTAPQLPPPIGQWPPRGEGGPIVPPPPSRTAPLSSDPNKPSIVPDPEPTPPAKPRVRARAGSKREGEKPKVRAKSTSRKQRDDE